MASIFSISEKS